MRVLAKAGITPYGAYNYSPNPEIEQVMSALGGTNSQKGDIMSLLPYLMLGNNSQTQNTYDPNFLKSIMTTTMMHDFGNTFFNTDSDNTY